MKTIYNDLTPDCSISSYNLIGGSDISALTDPRLSRYAEFSYVSGITITLTFPVSVEFSAIGIAGHTLTGDVSLSVNGGTAVTKESKNSFMLELDSPVSGTVFTLKFESTETSNGAIVKIGRLLVGDVYTFPAINDNVSFDLISTADVSFSASRQVYGNPQVQYSRISVQLPVVEQSEKKELDTLFSLVDLYSPLILDFDETCFDEGPFYCILGGSDSFGYQFNDAHFWTIGLTFEEVF